jgi:hypothetical protein
MLQSRFATSGTYAILSNTDVNLVAREQGIRETLGKGWKEVKGYPSNFGVDNALGCGAGSRFHDGVT